MKIWSIAWKDLKIQFKDKGAMLLLFVVPIVVITIASFALSGLIGGGATAIKVPVIDQDQSDLSQHVIMSLKQNKALVIEETLSEAEPTSLWTEERAKTAIKDGNRSVAILIPEGFAEKIKSGESTELILLRNPAEQIADNMVKGILNGFATELSANMITVKVAYHEIQSAGVQNNAEELIPKILENANQSWTSPPVQVSSEDVVTINGNDIDPFKQNVPGYAVMFALFTMLSGGSALLKEKQLGTYRRLLTAPISKASILAGKLLPIFLTALLQMTIFFAFGHLVFGMELGNSILGLFIMAGAVALAATSMGIFMAALVKTEAQLSGLSILIILLMSSLGGSWWPLEIVPDFMRTLAHFITINAWAMDGFKELLWYGNSAVSILPEAGVLLGMSLITFGVGILRFRFD